MEPMAYKRCLEIKKPDGQDALANRERLLSALGDIPARVTLPVMQRLYPLLQDADYRVTVTLSPSELGWDVICIEPGDTTGRLYGLALDIGSTTLEMELLDLNSGATLANVQR